jgi:hypothetical protein
MAATAADGFLSCRRFERLTLFDPKANFAPRH